MITRTLQSMLAAAVVLMLLAISASASTPLMATESELEAAFGGAEKVDLRTCQVPSVVKLRDVVKIPPPDEPVLVKTFKRGSFPEVLQPIFENKQIAGVTINGRFVAILHTDLHREYDDVLAHELVHAYITMVSPKPLGFTFQEASAVHFSTDKARKFYGQPSEDQTGMMVGRTVELTDAYKQKLRYFHFLIETSGEEKFYEWYKQAVLTGDTSARELVGLEGDEKLLVQKQEKKSLAVWIGLGIVAVLIALVIMGIYVSRRETDLY